jgi:hypothetical protein
MDYTVEQHEAGPVSVSLDNLESQLADVLLTGLVPESEFLSFKALEISGGKLQFPEITLSIETIRLVDPFVDAWLGEDGQVGLLQLLPGGDRPSTAKEPASHWLISIDEFSVENGLVSASDRSIKPHATLGIEKISLNLTGIDNRANTTMPINMDLHLDEGGSVGFDGQVVTLPELMLSGKVSAADIPLVLAQPYVQQQLAIAVENGLFGTDFEIKLQADGAVQAAGELTVSELQIRDTVENEPLLAWERMVVDRYEVDSSAASAHLSSIRFDKPYGRIEINEDRRTNLGGLMPEKEEKVNSDEDGPVWSATVGGVAIDDGSMDFSDLSLPLHFATHITDLDGTISTIDSESAEPADIRLEGQVDQYGLARIKGSMNLLDPVDHTDVSVEFRNLLMTRLSPYTAEFAGREIDEGKLDLDLEYVINGGQLNGRNAVVLSDLVLGAKVDNPDAVSLPLGLAVALLKNSEGVIDIELPVEGDVNSPEFRIGGVIWKAFAGLITKVVSAPFKLLGSLIGIESEDFGQFQFLAGRHDLTPPEIEKIAQLQQALAQRPELSLEIGGVYDTAVDLPALQYESLRNTAIEHLGRNPAEEGNSEEMLGQEIRELFETLYRERFPDSPLEELKAAHSTPLEDDPDGKPVLDETAYAGDLRDRLIASEPLGEDELKQLASNRAKAVADAFQAGGELDPSRFRLTEPLETKSEDSEWIVMELGIATE